MSKEPPPEPSLATGWHQHQRILQDAGSLHLGITHAHYGEIHAMQGRNCIPYSRLLFMASACGHVELSVEGLPSERVPLQAKHVLFIPPQVEMSYAFERGRLAGLHVYIESFPGLDLMEQEAPRCLPASELGVDPEALIQELEGEEGFAQSFEVMALVFRSLSRLSSPHPDTIRQQAALRLKYAELNAIIEERLSALLTVEALAAELGLTRDQLSKRFRKDLGESLKAYLTRLLIRRSCGLLMNGLPVKDCAEILKFSSEYYFSRFFKKHVGIRPSDYMHTLT